MAKKKARPTVFRKGQSGNPAGTSKKQRESTKETNDLRRANASQLVLAGDEILNSTVHELYLIAEDTNKFRSLKVVLSKLMIKALVDGDQRILSMIIDYCIGKPKDMVEVTGKDGGPLQTNSTVANMTIEQMQAELAAIRARKREAEK